MNRSLASEAVRVLVVDDDMDTADLFGLIFDESGCCVAVAHGGERALCIAESLRPDVVLLDLSMPGMSGLEVCRRLRLEAWGKATESNSSIPVGFAMNPSKPDSFASTWSPSRLERRFALKQQLSPRQTRSSRKQIAAMRR
ncbi:response regulator [Ramlibacter rhizophilus]|uniref:Response regulator n=1 Tax=Ramlibacter rhizophilus TaxID=1781167 RepID=A0A4Z0BZE0_9BURK|nr:response regulator [Ramlibacter rhizophilus]TFZ03375.1 response regulator [Ramlibacter rhizophilus]